VGAINRTPPPSHFGWLLPQLKILFNFRTWASPPHSSASLLNLEHLREDQSKSLSEPLTWVRALRSSSSTISSVFVTLVDMSPRWLGVAQDLPSLWLSPRKFVLPPSMWGLIVKNWIDLGCRSERFRVERNLVLYGHLNGDVCVFVVLNFGNKSCVLCTQIAFYSKFMFMFLLS
jgi:hypothetical protein